MRSDAPRQGTLSVVVPTYNHAGYLAGALEAILAQSFKPIEVIVIDDGSTDDSAAVVAQFARESPLVRYYRNATNQGNVAACRRGLEISSGEYVYIGGADDRVLPSFFEKAMALLRRYPEAGLCHSDISTLDGTTNRFYISRDACYLAPAEMATALTRTGYTASFGNSILRKAALLEAGGLRPELRWRADVWAALVIGVRHGICYIPEPLVALRTDSNSFSLSGRKRWAGENAILREMLRLLESAAHDDVAAWIRRTGVFPMAHPDMLRVLWSTPRYRRYLSGRVIQSALWYGLKEAIHPFAPASVKRIYYRVRDEYRKSTRRA